MRKNQLHAWLLSFAIICFSSAFAQGQTNSQKRQEQKLEKENDKIFGDEDQGFRVKTVPDKWKNESAVILDQNIQFEYYTASHEYTCDEYVRKRIMLLDKAAIEANSTFSFLPNQEVGFRVIKKDGTMKKVSALDAVDIKEGLPTSYSLFGRSTSSLYSNTYTGYKSLLYPTFSRETLLITIINLLRRALCGCKVETLVIKLNRMPSQLIFLLFPKNILF